MASERSPVVDYAIIVLLLLNLGITTYSTFKSKPDNLEPTAKSGSKLNISDSQAAALAENLIKLYNAKDNIGLYQQFDKLAQAQISQDQLTAQLNQLYPVMGTISDAAFSNAVLSSNEGGRDYFTLNYKIRLSGGPFTTGDMRLTVTPKESGFGLMGFFINGTSQAVRQ